MPAELCTLARKGGEVKGFFRSYAADRPTSKMMSEGEHTMKLSNDQRQTLKQIRLGAQRLRLDHDFAILSRRVGPLTIRELLLLAYLAGRG